MVKATLLITSIAAIATSVMAYDGPENALPTAVPTLVARAPEDRDATFSSFFNDPEGIQKHLSRASERLNHLPSAAREPAQSRIAEAGRSIANIRPTGKDGKIEESFPPTPSATGTVPTGNADIAADASKDVKLSGSCNNRPISALSVAISAIVAVNALM